MGGRCARAGGWRAGRLDGHRTPCRLSERSRGQSRCSERCERPPFPPLASHCLSPPRPHLPTARRSCCAAHASSPWTTPKPEASALAVVDGRIAAIGSADDVAPYLKGAKVYDLPGALVLPGFQDSHNHLVWSATELQDVDLSSVADTQGLKAAIEAGVASLPADAWVRASGWDISAFPDASAAILDEITGARPAYLAAADGHSAWVNSAALKAAGIDAASKAPDGGRIELGADGKPNGLLRESAMELVSKLLARLSRQPGRRRPGQGAAGGAQLRHHRHHRPRSQGMDAEGLPALRRRRQARPARHRRGGNHARRRRRRRRPDPRPALALCQPASGDQLGKAVRRRRHRNRHRSAARPLCRRRQARRPVVHAGGDEGDRHCRRRGQAAAACPCDRRPRRARHARRI